jgi:hypothetical protein
MNAYNGSFWIHAIRFRCNPLKLLGEFDYIRPDHNFRLGIDKQI